MDWCTAVKASLATALLIPGLFGVMCFVLWENGFKFFGWKYIARLTLVMALLPWVFEAIDAYKGLE